MQYIVKHNKDKTVTIDEVVYRELHRKAVAYECLCKSMEEAAKAIIETAQEGYKHEVK